MLIRFQISESLKDNRLKKQHTIFKIVLSIYYTLFKVILYSKVKVGLGI